MTEPLLSMESVCKSFFGVPVLRNVCVAVAAGSSVGLVGENGAGKSTLMNIAGGNLQPDSGHMRWNGEIYRPHWPLDAESRGIAFIHQELNLFGNLNIAENLFLTRFPRRGLAINRRTMHRQAADLLSKVGLDLPPTTAVDTLSAGEKQLVEIARALNGHARLVILDEPTTSLTQRETESLFALLKSLQRDGIALIYISHGLGDVQSLCDHVVVLRDGAVVAQGDAQDYDTAKLVRLMVGRDLEGQFPPITPHHDDAVVLSASSLCQPGVIDQISFDVHRGEVLGIAGLMGSGRTELARILFGLDPVQRGTLLLDGKAITSVSTRGRIQAGMAMLTESRRDDGLCEAASIDDNMGLAVAPKFAGRWFGQLDRNRLTRAIAGMRSTVCLTPTAAGHRPVRTLSGGNQQKVVLGKWILTQPRLLILDEPTRGIDVGARYEIYRQIAEMSAKGVAVLVISSELEELLGICHRLLVMSQGTICDQLSRAQFDRERIMRAALTSHRLGK